MTKWCCVLFCFISVRIYKPVTGHYSEGSLVQKVTGPNGH